MKKSNTRRSLLLSALSLLVCVSMLIGSTFAWFTDSVESGVNKIEAGNLDIELYHGKEAKPETNKVEGAEHIFTDVTNNVDILWEPGVVAWTNLNVVNKGSLALKYQLAINFDKATANANGDTLAKVLKVGFIKDGIKGTTREAVLAEVKEWKTLASFVQSGTLDAADHKNDIYGVVIYWEPSAIDNEFNLNNGQTGTMQINLGINLVATQKDAEFDSFGNDYDEDAIYYDSLVTTAEELYAAVASASGNAVIAIDGNIVMSKALSKSGLQSITFVAYDEDATIDQATYNMHFAGAKVTFNGLTLTHGEKAYGNGGQSSTAFAVWDAKEVNYIDCTFNRSVGTLHASLHNFIGCTFNGVENPGNTKSEYPLYICDGQDYNVVDCVFNCTNRGAILFYNDGGSGTDTLNISNTKFFGDIIDDKTAVEIHNNSATQIYNVNIKDVVVGDKIINGLYRIKPANVGKVNVTVDGVTEVATASTASELGAAINAAQPGDTIYLNTDVVYTGNNYAKIEKDITLDLNGNNIATTKYGVVAKAGTIKNGTVTNPVGSFAALRTWSGVSVENVIIEAPENGGITVASGNSLPYIKNVTIKAKTYGIELQYGASVGTIENVNIDAGENGIIVQAGTIGNITNSVIKGGNAGIWGQLKGIYDLKVALDGTNEIRGGKYGVYLCDEGANIVTPGSAYLNYAEAITIDGGLKDMEFAFGQTGKLVVNDVLQ